MPRRELSRAPRQLLQAVTFDVTDTLIHAPRRAELYCRVLGRHGLQVEPRQVEHTLPEVWTELSCRADPRRDRFADYDGGASGFWHRFVERLCERLGTGVPSRFAAAELFDRFAHANAWQVYEDVEPALAALRGAGLRLAAISNWDRRLPLVLERLDLARWFEVVVCSEDVGVEKPHPEIFRHGLRKLQVEPGRALHVGDNTLKDIEGALAVGMRALRVDRGTPGPGLHELLLPLTAAAADQPKAVQGEARDYDTGGDHAGF